MTIEFVGFGILSTSETLYHALAQQGRSRKVARSKKLCAASGFWRNGQNQAAFGLKFCDLLIAHDRLDILVGGFDFQHATRRNQAVRERIGCFGFLVGRYQRPIGQARADAARMIMQRTFGLSLLPMKFLPSIRTLRYSPFSGDPTPRRGFILVQTGKVLRDEGNQVSVEVLHKFLLKSR